jgi:GTP-binding protein
LQLKVIADIGIIGMPNAGKSSLLASITRAKPKIASYPFTTIDPNLGVAYYDDKEVVLADIPGLVEGAHKGIGLGDKFLRHVERCKILLHLIDLSDDNLLDNYLKIRNELSEYDGILEKKKELIFFNKSDLLEENEIEKKLKKFKKSINKKFEVISIFSKKDLLKTKKILLKNVIK